MMTCKWTRTGRAWKPVLLGSLLLFSLVTAAGSDLSSPVADAAENEEWEAVQALVKEGADVNAVQSDGMTAFHWAVYLDNVETVKALVEAGAGVSVENRYGIAPLSIACVNGNPAVVRSLLEAGADANRELEGGETALMTASRTGRVEPVKLLLDHGAEIDAKERKGQTALMWAAADGHAEVVELLLERGADFKTPLDSGFTPFFFAVREGNIDVAQKLLAAGVDVNEAMAPERRASRGPGKGTSPLLLAVENGHFELAVELLGAGADPNDQRTGFTPLHTLTWVRKPNRGDGADGHPPPQGSGKVGSLQFVRELVAHGANVNVQLERGSRRTGRLNMEGATPLLLAAKTADLPLLELLVELGADPLLPNVDGSTPLMAAAGLGTYAPTEEAGTEPEAVAAVQFLLAHGADVNAVDALGETAMHGAAYKSLPEVVRLLAERDAEIEVWNRKNKHGWTPLLIAQGFRPGNFKPAPETRAALEEVMLAQGVVPPPPPERGEGNYTE